MRSESLQVFRLRKGFGGETVPMMVWWNSHRAAEVVDAERG